MNSIVHPEVWKRIAKEAKDKEKEYLLVVIEAAILPDKSNNIYDETWYIYSGEKIRRERLKKSRFYNDDQIDSIMSKQSSEEEYCRFCDRVIENNSSAESLRYKISLAIEDIVGKYKKEQLNP